MSQSSQFKRPRFSIYFLLGAILVCILGFILQTPLQALPLSAIPGASINSNNLPPNTTVLLLTFAGALGGVLYAIRNNEFECPRCIKGEIKPGVLADFFFGIAGAYVIVLITPGQFPTEPNPTENKFADLFIEILATGIIGGYGGRSLMDRALGDILRHQKVLENDQKQLKGQVDSNTSRIDDTPGQIEKQVAEKTKNISTEVKEQFKEQAKIDAEATTLLANYFDKSLPSDEQVEELEQLIKTASSKQKADILLEAKKVRETARANRKSFIVRRTIPVFKALAESNTNDDGEIHPIYAQLGYAFMIKEPKKPEDWRQAEANLNKAIKTRNRSLEKTPDKKASFWVYEFNRAICRIKLHEDSGLILIDLQDAAELQKSATGDIEYQDILDKDTKDLILKWMKDNSPEDLDLIKWLRDIFGGFNYSPDKKDSELFEWFNKIFKPNDSNESHAAEAAP